MKQAKRLKIEKGSRVGALTVLSDTGRRKNGYTVWLCGCSCGGSIALDTRTLQRGTVRDCGCISKLGPRQKDLTGQRFGRLVALEPTQGRYSNGATVWRCRCDCGGETLAVSTQLTQGYKKSCGCMSHPPVRDLTGQRFSRLVVTGYGGKSGGAHRWICRCDCGGETVVRQDYLLTGKTKSCGCLQAQVVTENMKFVEGTSVTLLEKAGGRLGSTNSSGYNGVYFNRRTQRWTAQIGFKGKNFYLGSYSKIEDAVRARKKAEERLYGEFLEWYYETYPHKK